LRVPDLIAAGGSSAAPGIPAALRSHDRPRSADTSLAWWLVPDLALIAAVVALIYLFVFFGGAQALFRDADAGWHIRAGDAMLTSGALPHADTFSFSRAGARWMAWEWGSDVAAAVAWRAGGLGGVACVYALAIAASVWMWFRLNWAAGGNFLLACLFASPMLSTVNLHWLARPHVFGWILLLGAVWFCERMPARLGRAHLAGAVVFGSLWANLHGSFFLGPVVALAYAAGAAAAWWIWEEPRGSARNYLVLAGAALAGTFLNPNGWGLHRHVAEYLSDSALLDRIGEFQSFNFHSTGSAQIILALLIGMVGGCAALAARRPERFLLALILTAGALRSARMLPVAALVLLPLGNGSISAALSRATLSARMGQWVDEALAYGDRLRFLDRSFGGHALLPFLLMVLPGAVRASHPGFPADQFPVAASNAVAALPADARVFSSDKFGGYLIYRFAGERKVFFDGRSDFYGADFLRRYGRMVQVRPGWSEEFDRWGFTHALLPVDFSLIPALEGRGWVEVYRDRTAVLLAHPAELRPAGQAEAPAPPMQGFLHFRGRNS